MEPVRHTAVQILKRVIYQGAYADIALGSALSRSTLETRDRSLVTEIVYGVLRRLATLDWTLDGMLKRPVSKAGRDLAIILRVGAYQILYLDRIPAYAVVDTSVDLARAHGGKAAAGLVNAILRRLLREGPRPLPSWDKPVERISVERSHPLWMVQELVKYFGVSTTQGICAANNDPPPLSVRINGLKSTWQDALDLLSTDGVTAHSCRYSDDGLVIDDSPEPVDSLKGHRDGSFYVMDEAAMLVAPALSPRPGDTVLDACAAPGGKTAHLADIMDNNGRIIALDVNNARLELVRDNCKRLGVNNVEPELLDARKAGSRFPGRFDAALVDAPCSGLGVLRRRPDLRWRKRDIESLTTLQAEILDSVALSVKPGGILVYATCSIHPDENEGSVQRFLTRNPGFRMDGLGDYLPNELRQYELSGTLQLMPHVHGTDGFFIARMRKDRD